MLRQTSVTARGEDAGVRAGEAVQRDAMPGDESSVAPDAMPSAGEGNVDGGSGQRAGDARLPPLDERTVTEPDLVRHVHRQLRLLDRLDPWADGQEDNALPVRPPRR